MPQFIARAREQSTRDECEVIVMLLPADTSTKYFPWDADAICWLSFKIPYGTTLRSGSGFISAPFPSVLVIFANIKKGVSEKQIECLSAIGHGWVVDAGRFRAFGNRLIVSRVPDIDHANHDDRSKAARTKKRLIKARR